MSTHIPKKVSFKIKDLQYLDEKKALENQGLIITMFTEF